MRIFIAGIATETNTFAPFPTTQRGFEEHGLYRGDASVRGQGPFELEARTYRELAERDGFEVVESVVAFAQPAGRVTRAAYEGLREELLTDLKRAGPVDIIFLILHGAMAADGYDDCEGDLLAHCRALAPEAALGAVLDPHCHMTETMVREADLLIPMKLYPHTDFVERCTELYALCVRIKRDGLRPVGALANASMIGFYPTPDPPMADIVAELHALEAEPGVLSAGIAHGFPWGDVADVGTQALVYAETEAKAREGAMKVARRLYDTRHELRIDYPGIEGSLAKARGLNGRIVLGDFADNPGGGAPGDSTFFLRALLDHRVSAAALGLIYDPAAAQICADAGVGARLPIRLGGKAGPMSGEPLDVTVEVKNVVEHHSQAMLGGRQQLGLAVWLRIDDVDVGVCSVRSQTFSPDAFTGLGIELTDKRIVVVKSSNHYQAGFRPEADHLWHVSSPGAMTMDFGAFGYTKRDGNYFPRVDDPWAVGGQPEARLFKRGERSVAA